MDRWDGMAPPETQEEVQKLAQLREMGFEELEALKGLRKASGDVEMAMVGIVSEREEEALRKETDTNLFDTCLTPV